jgi:glucosylceramidase
VATLLPTILVAVLTVSTNTVHAASSKLEAETGTLGSEYAVGNDGTTTYIYPITNGAGSNPGSSARTVTYSVTLPAAGTYDLYVRVWIGPGGGNDDSFFVGNGFGTKSPANSADWLTFNSLASVGFTNDNDVVTGDGTASTQVWKWINLSQLGTVVTFTVAPDALTQTIQIGAREDGLFIDTFVFGTHGYQFTVADLNAGASGNPPPPPPPPISNLDWNNVRQRIDGFGASSAWRSSWTTAQADMFFTDTDGTAQSSNGSNFSFRGIGLSLLRSRIAPDGSSVETNIMQMAQARGAKVWSTPWSPPVQYKDSGSLNGGNFESDPLNLNYQGYANQLANYVQSMKSTYGIDLYAISVQNEPDISTTYESCKWTAQQIHDFIPYLSDALASKGFSPTKVLLPEKSGWDFSLASPTMNDSNTATRVGILADHDYGATAGPVNNYDKPLWETECSLLGGSDSSIGNGIYWAKRIHNFMTSVEANAWHYWWLISGGTGNEGLCDANWMPAKRMYTLGNFSRFVRPGYFRIGSTDNAPTAVLTSAYKDPDSYKFAVVAINQYGRTLHATFNLNGFPWVSSVTPWVTSDTFSLADQPTVTVTNSSFTYDLPAMSVVTFVGQAAKPATSLSTTSVAENQPTGTSVGTFSTTNGGPAETFTYSLVSGDGGDDNATFAISGNALQTGASFDYETKSSYSIRVRSTGQNGEYIEDAFTITVTNINETPTDIVLSNTTVAESQPAGTTVGSFSTTDPDGDTTSTYQLVSGAGSDDNLSFILTGRTLQTAAPFDYETKNSYAIRVRSTDQGGLSVEKAFTITVANILDTNVDFSLDLQRIDGFGAAFAFQKGNLIHGSLGLTPENQEKLVELLFSPQTGIGLSIVRLGIGSGLPGEVYDHMHSIEPTDPGGPEATPQYVWDHSDDNQVWISQQAYAYGVRRFLAAPWSAPTYMKTTIPSSDNNGGSLCGLLGTICEGSVRTDMGPPDQRIGDDWRQAYANYLAQWIKFYQQEGIQITDLSLQNEPNFTASYASMRFTNAQAVEFIKVLKPTLQASGLPVSLACCDATGWSAQAGYTSAIEADPVAKQLVDIHSGHQYGSPARTPLATNKAVWMTEWGLDGNTWNTAWDGGGSSASSDGIVLANDISDNLTLANINAYVYWVAASLGTTRGFVQIDNPGPNYHVSKRLWAMGTFSRYIRPGAYRVPATVAGPNLKISAFRNADGSRVINIINNSTTAAHRDLTLDATTSSAGLALHTYLTDETHSLSEVTLAQLNGQTLSVDLAPRSLTTFVLSTPSSSTDCYDDDDAHIAYSNGWHLISNSNASGGHFRLHNGKDTTHFASLTIDVPMGQTGALTLFYAKSPKGGSAQIYIDGAPAANNGTISFNGPNGSLRDPEFKSRGTAYEVTYSGLASGRHTFELRNLTDSVYIDGFCLENSVSYAQPVSGPGQTTSNSGSVGVGQQASSNLTIPSNAKEVSVLAEASGGLPIKLMLIDPKGLTLKIADSGNGIAILNAPVTQAGMYTIKVVNVSLGPIEVWTAATPLVSR